MVRIYVIDNGGQWTHREWRTLRYLGVDTKIVPNTTPFRTIIKDDINGLVLSGGAPRIGVTGELGRCREYLEEANVPILGICAGHQFMARYYGGTVEPSKVPEFGRVQLTVLKTEDPLFNQVPETSTVWESHNDEVTALSDRFEVLAKSESCPIQAIRHVKKPFYGLQFHPEVEHTEYGRQIFRNFIELCSR
jgi:GMP synthase (glutamine-hydrolysing)